MERKLVEVERGNVVLRVPEDNVQRYIDQGYVLTDGEGNIVQQGIPRDIGLLQKAFVEHMQLIEKLQAEIKELKSEKKKPATRKKASN